MPMLFLRDSRRSAMMETTILRRLPPVSARGALLLAGCGLVFVLAGLLGGAYLLIPAGLAFIIGLVSGFSNSLRVRLGTPYPPASKLTPPPPSFFDRHL